jgi:hypothetical protein
VFYWDDMSGGLYLYFFSFVILVEPT